MSDGYGVLQAMTAGKRVEYKGERYILLQNMLLSMPGSGETIFLAIREDAEFPAQTYVIPCPSDIHLKDASASEENASPA
jgi:hypothetical protein